MKYKVIVLFWFILLPLIIPSSIDGRFLTIHSIEDLLVPFTREYHNIAIMLLAIHLGFHLIVVYRIINSIETLSRLETYIISRSSLKEFNHLLMLRILKDALMLTVIFVISSLIFTIQDSSGYYSVLMFSISLFLSIIIWGCLILMLKYLSVSFRMISFILLTIILSMQILSKSFAIFSIFTVSSIHFESLHVTILIGKLILVLILFVLNLVISQQYESVGDKS